MDAELAWLRKAMQARMVILQNGDSVWKASVQRVVAFQYLLSSRPLSLSGVVRFSTKDLPNIAIRTGTNLAPDAPNAEAC